MLTSAGVDTVPPPILIFTFDVYFCAHHVERLLVRLGRWRIISVAHGVVQGTTPLLKVLTRPNHWFSRAVWLQHRWSRGTSRGQTGLAPQTR